MRGRKAKVLDNILKNSVLLINTLFSKSVRPWDMRTVGNRSSNTEEPIKRIAMLCHVD